MQMKIRKAAVLVPVLIVIIGVLGGSVLMGYLFVFSLLILIFGYVWARMSLEGVEVKTVNIPDSARAGERIEGITIIHNRSRFSRYGLTVEEITDMPGYRNRVTLEMSPYSYRSWQTDLNTERRGLFSLGLFTISTTDPFGFITLQKTAGEKSSLLVFPAALDIPLFHPEKIMEPGKGSDRWLRSGTSSTISRVREYVDGDTLNHVHWPSSVHTGTLMVKVFEPEQVQFKYSNVWLIADMTENVQSGRGDESTEEYAVMITSSLYTRYTKTGLPAGLIVSGDRRHLFPPDTNRSTRRDIERMLATVKATGNEPIDTIIDKEKHRFQPDSIVILITPSTSTPVASAVTSLQSTGCMTVTILIDSSGFGTHAGAAPAVRAISTAGSQVYTVKKGQPIAEALDSRKLPSSHVYGA
ncbi:MAG: DUF58 domain-containing protein [Dehalococcoidales bacterium]|nr:DUF58 domain-containing protein [Dehalococcoidales bacterium]